MKKLMIDNLLDSMHLFLSVSIICVLFSNKTYLKYNLNTITSLKLFTNMASLVIRGKSCTVNIRNPYFWLFGFQTEVCAINSNAIKLNTINPNGSYVLVPFGFRLLQFGNQTASEFRTCSKLNGNHMSEDRTGLDFGRSLYNNLSFWPV